jgi:hypothetical protein
MDQEVEKVIEKEKFSKKKQAKTKSVAKPVKAKPVKKKVPIFIDSTDEYSDDVSGSDIAE